MNVSSIVIDDDISFIIDQIDIIEIIINYDCDQIYLRTIEKSREKSERNFAILIFLFKKCGTKKIRTHSIHSTQID